MATYLWVGGYTGFTGTNSGWSGQYGGASAQVWTSVASGATSASGDIFFTPYAWNIRNNWRTRVTLPGNSFGYLAATGTPAGGDTVLFGGVTSGTGTPLGEYSISCLYGGLSGDGPTAYGSGAGSTGWSNGTTASRYGDVSFTISAMFKPTSNPFGFRTGEIGAGETGTNDLSLYFPLRIRTSSVSHNDSAMMQSGAAGPINISLKNLSTSTPGAYFFNSNSQGATGSSNTVLSGTWYYIRQRAGSLFLTDCTTTYLIAEERINQLVTDNTTTMEDVRISPTFCTNGVRVWGSINGPVGSLAINGWTNQNAQNSFATIGDFGNGVNPTFTNFLCAAGNTGTSGIGPILKLATVEVENFKGDNGTVMVHPDVTRYDYCILRDGYLRNDFTINMNHPTDNLWQNFMLGYAPSDQGLRIDSQNVNITCYAGQSLKSAAEGITYG